MGIGLLTEVGESKEVVKSITYNPTGTLASMTYGNAGDGSFDINGLNFGVTASGTISFSPIIGADERIQ